MQAVKPRATVAARKAQRSFFCFIKVPFVSWMVVDGGREAGTRLAGSKFPLIVNQDKRAVNEKAGFPPPVGIWWKILFL